MKRTVVATALAVMWTSCFTAAPTNGVLLCRSAEPRCPEDYHCAVDTTCWKNGDDPVVETQDLLGADLLGADLLSRDLMQEGDLLGLDLTGVLADMKQACTVDVCDGNMLKVCQGSGEFVATDCGAIGCADGPPAHCKVITPQAPVAVTDLKRTSLAFQNVASGSVLTINGTTGQILGVRNPNADPAIFEINNFVGFRVENGVAIFNFANFVVAEGGAVQIIGDYPVAIVAVNNVSIEGVVTSQAGSGGGGSTAQAGAGPGGGTAPGNGTISGGGAGFGDKGGAGTADMAFVNGGTIYGASLSPLVGGSGGSGGFAAGSGGRGGGALQLVAGGTITLGGGSAIGGINAGGLGGQSAGTGSGGGGGGGSGGAVLLQAQSVVFLNNGGLAANGGGGGCGQTPTTPAQDGQLGSMRAMGADCASSDGFRGGAAGAPVGESSTGSGTGQAGGGAVGRIRIDTLSGTPTLPASYVLSPALDDVNTIGEHPTTFATIGTE